MVKRLMMLLLALVAAIALSACAAQPAEESPSATAAPSVTPTPDLVADLTPATGRVVSIDGMTYTLALGEAAPAAGEKLEFTASGRLLEVNMSGAVMRAADGSAEPDSPVSDIVAGDVVTVYLTSSDDCGYVTVLARAQDVTGETDALSSGGAAAEITEPEEIVTREFVSEQADENALRASGVRATLTDVNVTKRGDSSDPEGGPAHGQNAALLAADGADVIIRSSRISSEAEGAAGVVSYGSGTAVSISGSEISTSGGRSDGLRTAAGGAADAQNLTVSTAGQGSAAIRSGGPVTVNGGMLTTAGLDAPVLHAGADTAISAAELRAGNAEALVVAGASHVILSDCTVEGAMNRTEAAAAGDNVHSVLIFRTDAADDAPGAFAMRGGSITSRNGDVFYITNTRCAVELSGVDVTNRDQRAWLFNVAGNDGSLGWGTAGRNGAHADITLRGQSTIGDTRVDSVSSVTMHLTDGTYLRGGIRLEQNPAAPPEARGAADVVIDEGCTWSLTGNSEVSTLENNGVVEFNGFTVTLADGTVLSS